MPACMKINAHKKKMHPEETMRKPCVNLTYFPGLSFKTILIYNCKVMSYSTGQRDCSIFDAKPKCGLLQIKKEDFFVRCSSLSTNLAMLEGF